MTTTYTVSIHLTVTDRQALHAHAMTQATTGDGALNKEEALRMLGTSDEPSVSDCLCFILDPGMSPPGTSILDSSCEAGIAQDVGIQPVARIKAEYEDGVCPDCGQDIPDNAKHGEECGNCGHVWNEPGVEN